MADRPSRSWILRVLKIGLGCLAIVIILIGSTVILNWGRIRTAYQSTVASLSELQTVRSAIQSKYDNPNVAVHTKRLLTQPSRVDGPLFGSQNTSRIEVAQYTVPGDPRNFFWGTGASVRCPDRRSTRDEMLNLKAP